MWNITKIVSKGDYLYGVCKDHPKCTKNGYVLLHRLVMENHLCRILGDDEVVHHKNHDKKDNSIENLEVMFVKDHSRLHANKGRSVVSLVCPECEQVFEREKRNVVGRTNNFCSRKCNGTFQRKVQLNNGTVA